MAEDKLTLNRADHVVTACFGGQSVLTSSDIQALREQLADVIRWEKPACLIVDFTGLGMLGSEVLGMLVDLHRMQHENDAQLIVCGLAPAMHKVLKITRLDLVLTFADNASDAMELARAQSD
ncbi:MAG: STAS domain-containing protein [Phycisphaerae bacterium]